VHFSCQNTLENEIQHGIVEGEENEVFIDDNYGKQIIQDYLALNT
jgi:hypothetical protein